LVLAAAVGASAGTVIAQPGGRPAPVLDARERPTEYLGPGRELAPPTALREIPIAFFGPADPHHADWGDAWRGAVMALEDANAGGGCGGLPFRLAGAWSENPWGSGVSGLAKLVYGERVWAILGGVDGASTHLAEQIVVKARLAVVSPGGTDPSVNFTNVPWMFTLPATDDRIAPVLASAVFDRSGGGPWALVSTADRDAHAAWRDLRTALAARSAPAPALHLVLPAADPPYDDAATETAASSPRAVLVLGGAREAARAVKALRAAGFRGDIVGGAPLGRRPFVEEAGAAAEGVLFPLLFDPSAPGAATFVRAYEARWGSPPDFLAAHAYDAMRLLADATRRAGPNRARIRDALAEIAPWQGVTGPIQWDLTGRNQGPVTLGVWRAGRAVKR
jgi:ABC-type branched-subunit amino acid transport system substrate-binding protein